VGRTLTLRTESLRFREPFAISGYVFEAMPALVATIGDGEHLGRGEACGVYYLGDDADHMLAAAESVRAPIEAGIGRAELQGLLPPGGARNALDCALWELEAAQAGCLVWQLAGLGAPKPRVSTMTAGADTPEAMARAAGGFAGARAIKLKLTGEPDLDCARVAAVRRALPGVWLGVDANQGYGRASLEAVLPTFVELGVKLVEQPLPRGEEAGLDGLDSPIPIAADESVLSSGDMQAMLGRCSVINVKLDKCGGLTEALRMVDLARQLGFDLMVGNMGGSSWAMAAGFIVAQACDIVDLDGPLWLARDRKPSVSYPDGAIWSDETVWGGGVRSP
jgi:L-alanine-DL-glutamate epimerase-like enolase superfamily enzyme